MLRLSQTMCHRVLRAALLSKSRKKRPKSFSVRLSPTTPSTLPVGDVEGGDQALSAVAGVLDLPPLDLARHHRQSRRDALQRLNAGHLVDGNGATSVIGAGCSLIDLADVGALAVESGIGLRGQPVTEAMGFEVGLFFKKRPTERCEMLGPTPRRIASAAISRSLQWLIRRPLSHVVSQLIATSAEMVCG